MKRSTSSLPQDSFPIREESKKTCRIKKSFEDVVFQANTQFLHSQLDSRNFNHLQKELCQTFGTNNFFKMSRPESKQSAVRSNMNRPDTSKRNRMNNELRRRQNELKQNQMQYEEETKPFKDIEIIVNSLRNEKLKPKNLKSKFETDLDEQFLALFAN